MKTREWLLIIFIVMLVQFIVQVSAWLYGSNQSALGYISFAGTIVSIILAVLAIVYSYVQSITQQNSSNTIANQVNKLIDVVERVDDSKSELNVSLDKLRGIRERLETSVAYQEKTHAAVDDINKKMSILEPEVLRKMFSMHAAGNKAEGVGGGGLSYSAPLEVGYGGLAFSCLLLYFGRLHGLSYEETETMLESTVEEVFHFETEEDLANSKILMIGHLMGTYQCFEAFGIVALAENDQYGLVDGFVDVCDEFVETFDEGQEEMVYKIINFLRDFDKSELKKVPEGLNFNQ